jgi:GrpB-like predicted nucleotidyltransferase (UPF0157 family)
VIRLSEIQPDMQDRALYADAKRGLVERDWTYVQSYADGKAEVVADIMTRARSWANHLREYR